MMEKAEKLGKKLLLPVDTTIADAFPNPIDAEIEVSVVAADAIPADKMGLDIGTKTAGALRRGWEICEDSCMERSHGRFENPILAKGTIAVAKALADTDATTIIGGGDSAAAVNQLGFRRQDVPYLHRRRRFSGILEGKDLPVVVAANDK